MSLSPQVFALVEQINQLRAELEKVKASKDDYLHNVRRSLERGLKLAQESTEDTKYLDLFQRCLDELMRAGIQSPETKYNEDDS